MMRVEITEKANGERRAEIRLDHTGTHIIPIEKAAMLAVWIEELLPEEVARARQAEIPSPTVRTDETE